MFNPRFFPSQDLSLKDDDDDPSQNSLYFLFLNSDLSWWIKNENDDLLSIFFSWIQSKTILLVISSSSSSRFQISPYMNFFLFERISLPYLRNMNFKCIFWRIFPIEFDSFKNPHSTKKLVKNLFFLLLLLLFLLFLFHVMMWLRRRQDTSFSIRDINL